MIPLRSRHWKKWSRPSQHLAREVRSSRPSVPVLLVSGYAEEDGVDPDLPRLTKPFRKHELALSLGQLTSA